MNLSTVKRKQMIYQYLQERGSVSTAELAEIFHASPVTIHRDLVLLSRQGIVTLEHGGATMNHGSLSEFTMEMKERSHIAEKNAIARKCLDYVHEGQSLYLDAGSTVAAFAKMLVNWENLTVLTHSLLAANAISKSKSVKVIMCPGVFRNNAMAYIGPMTSSFIENFHIDILFLSTNGVDLEYGASVMNTSDAATKRSLIKHADKVICVTDSSKFGLIQFSKVCSLSKIDLIVTDSGLNQKTLEQYRRNGVNIDIAPTD